MGRRYGVGALQQFKAKKPYKQGWLIGSAGTYGYSTGNHINKEYNDERIIMEYRKRPKYEGFTDGQILENWLLQKRIKAFINDYKIGFYWGNKAYTRYASDKLFKGL